MTVDKAVEIVNKIVANTLEEYEQSPDSKYIDDQGVEQRKPHPLDIVDPADVIFALDMAIKSVALKAAPVSLIETSGSTASELRRISTDYYIRVPSEPVSGADLDIDDGLSYAVVFKALFSLWKDYSEYEQKAESIINTYIQAYRQYIADLIAGNVGTGAEAYIRFSQDGTTWHDSFTPGDIYISFKKIDTDTWTPSIKFVGSNGADGAPGTPCSDTQFVALQDTPGSYEGMAGKAVVVNSDENGVVFGDVSGGGASKFVDLTDTPNTLTAGKTFRVNADGTGLEEIDLPSGTVTQFGDAVVFDDQASGSISLDAKTKNSFYIYPTGDLTIGFVQFDDGSNQNASAMFGTVYTFFLVSGASTAIIFNSNEVVYGDNSVELGSASANSSITATLLRMYYDGFSWIVIDRVVVNDYNP